MRDFLNKEYLRYESSGTTNVPRNVKFTEVRTVADDIKDY